MRILCTGSRDWSGNDAIIETIESVAKEFGFSARRQELTFVHGACPTGADAMVDRAALTLSYRVERHPADWERHGKAAGPIRNSVMTLLGADLCLAFWDGFSRGTLDCITQAVKTGIPVRIIPRGLKPVQRGPEGGEG